MTADRDTCFARIIRGPEQENAELDLGTADVLILADEPGWSEPGVYLLGDGTFARLKERPEQAVCIRRTEAKQRPADPEIAAAWLARFGLRPPA